MSGSLIEGIYRDRLIGPNNRELFDSGWKSNMIVLRCRVLLAGFMKNEESAGGIRLLKVGSGDADWDNLAQPPKPDPNSLNDLVKTALTIPVTQLTLEYLNAKTSDPSPNQKPTNCIQISATLGPGQPAGADPFPLREFGLFGQMNDEEFMIDYIRHPLIEKDSLMTLERKVRLIF
jgi:hypothetical protein